LGDWCTAPSRPKRKTADAYHPLPTLCRQRLGDWCTAPGRPQPDNSKCTASGRPQPNNSKQHVYAKGTRTKTTGGP